MNRHPTTSSSSHLLEGVLLEVSAANQNLKFHKLQAFSSRFRFRPREPFGTQWLVAGLLPTDVRRVDSNRRHKKDGSTTPRSGGDRPPGHPEG
jgi:hypothetical protein